MVANPFLPTFDLGPLGDRNIPIPGFEAFKFSDILALLVDLPIRDIDAKTAVILSKGRTGTLRHQVKFEHDAWPAYELYVNTKNKHFHDPIPDHGPNRLITDPFGFFNIKGRNTHRRSANS